MFKVTLHNEREHVYIYQEKYISLIAKYIDISPPIDILTLSLRYNNTLTMNPYPYSHTFPKKINPNKSPKKQQTTIQMRTAALAKLPIKTD